MKTEIKKQIKDAWLLAKLKCGDHKGIGAHRFKIAARLGFSELNVFFDAMGGGRQDGKHECWVDVYDNGDSENVGSRSYAISDLLEDLNKWYIGKNITLTFGYNVWNKWGSETIKSETILEKEFTL